VGQAGEQSHGLDLRLDVVGQSKRYLPLLLKKS
jgi:hypothetical protein